jgi:hypothetical protein
MRISTSGAATRTVFLSTDATAEEQQELTQLLQQPDEGGEAISVVTYKEGVDENEGEGRISPMLMEQQVCALATVCLLNHWSTFSHTIRFWREPQRRESAAASANVPMEIDSGGNGKEVQPVDVWWG